MNAIRNTQSRSSALHHITPLAALGLWLLAGSVSMLEAADIEAVDVWFSTSRAATIQADSRNDLYCECRFSGLSGYQSWRISWRVNGLEIGSTTQNNRAPSGGYFSGGSETVSLSPINYTPSGSSVTLDVVVDADGQVSESNESNNSARRVYTVEIPPAPGKTTLYTPSGAVTGTCRPAFDWSGVSHATWYQIWLERNGAKLLQKWVSSSSWTPTSDLPLGDYQWWVQTYGPGGYGPWSSEATFSIAPLLPGTCIQQAPTGGVEAADGNVTFQWQAANDATWYHLVLNRGTSPYLSRWVQGTSWTPPDALPGGEYKWWIVGYNQDGYGPWAGPAFFGVPSGRPDVCVPQYPTGGVALESMTPAFEWSGGERSVWYQLWIERGGALHHKQWTQDTMWAPVGTYPGGQYSWWVRGWNPEGYGDWSGEAQFALPSNGPDQVTLLAPDSGTTDDNGMPTLSWSDQAAVTWYNLKVERNGVPYLNEWYQDVSWTPQSPLQSGNYTWQVRGWNSNGLGEWSQQWSFVVSHSGPSATTLVYPLGDVMATRPYFKWQYVSAADWYNIVAYKDGQPYLDVWEENTYWRPTSSLPPGAYTWWIQTWSSSSGLGLWSTPLNMNVRRVPVVGQIGNYVKLNILYGGMESISFPLESGVANTTRENIVYLFSDLTLSYDMRVQYPSSGNSYRVHLDLTRNPNGGAVTQVDAVVEAVIGGQSVSGALVYP